MARYKRYFPVSHDINYDPEVWALTEEFGDRALRFVLEIFSLLDQKNNYLMITPHLMKSLARTLRQSLAKCWRILGQMVANGWLIVLKTFADGSPSAVSARNYMEFHRSRIRNGDEKVPKLSQIGADLVGKGREGSSLTLTSSEEEERLREQKEKKGLQGDPLKKEKAPQKDSRTSWPANLCLTEHLRTYAQRQGVKDPAHEFETFHLKAKARGYQYIDWSSAWMTWCRNQLQHQGPLSKPTCNDQNRATADKVLHELSPKKEPINITPEGDP